MFGTKGSKVNLEKKYTNVIELINAPLFPLRIWNVSVFPEHVSFISLPHIYAVIIDNIL